MPDTKISALVAATALTGSEIVPAVQSGTTKAATIGQIGAYIKGALYPQVSNYAGLPTASTVPGDIYLVQTATGIWPVRRSAGLYRSDGSIWGYLGTFNWTASEITFVPASGVVSTDVQAAIVEVETTLLTHIGSGGANHALVVSAGASGFMSGTDKAKLDGLSSNAATATKLATARNINGIAFDGTASITMPVFSTSLQGDVPASTTADAKRLHADATWADEFAAICFVIDGAGAAITAGIKGDLTIPFACTAIDWTILCDQSGSIVVNLWKDTLANFPPDVADKITASLPPTVTVATKGNSSTLTGWTTAIAAGDVIRFNVDSVATVQRATITLKVKKA